MAEEMLPLVGGLATVSTGLSIFASAPACAFVKNGGTRNIWLKDARRTRLLAHILRGVAARYVLG